MDSKIQELEAENQLLRNKLKKVQLLSEKKAQRRKNLLKFIGKTIAGSRLKNSIYNLLEEYNSKKYVHRNTLSDFLASLINRITRVGIVTILFAILPSLLLMHQNILIKQQNKKIQEQTYLNEASRRSAQMFIMGDVLSDINNELDKEHKTSLSSTLVGRIVSLSKSMKPYNYLIGDQLTKKAISPERGQLLITLCKSTLCETSIGRAFFIDRILQESDFTKAELKNCNLQNATLKEINLTEANLSNSNLMNANLSYAVLINADLTNIDLTDANLAHANMSNCTLTNANLRFCNITGANFTNATLDYVKVNSMDWIKQIINQNIKGANEIAKNYKIDSIYSQDLDAKVPTLIKR